MPALRTTVESAKADLAAAGEPLKVVTLHPKVVDQYLRDLDQLDQLIAGDLAESDEGLAKALRAIIDKVSVMPAPARQPPEIRIEGHLEILLKRSFGECSLPGGVW